MTALDQCRETARDLMRRSGTCPRLGIILGSGFGALVKEVDDSFWMAISHIPGFPTPTTPGHAGQLVLGHWAGVPIAVLAGRPHFYEGHSLDEVTYPVRFLAALGVKALLLTNAAGGINRRFKPGDLMAITDHINLIGNPLRGLRERGAAPFIDLSKAYDPEFLALLRKTARRIRLPLRAGVYVAVSGPSYETPAEIRAFRRLGADAVGMSTVPEVIVARQCGLRVAALSCITNLAAGVGSEPLFHTDVLMTARRAERSAIQLLRGWVAAMPAQL